jgi:hypothetical protein
MARGRRNELELLSNVVDLLREACHFLNDDQDALARKTKRRLMTKSRDNAVFFENLMADLDALSLILAIITARSAWDNRLGLSELRDILDVIEQHFLRASNPPSPMDSLEFKSPFEPLEHLVDEFNDPIDELSMSQRGIDLFSRLNLSHTNSVNQELLLAAVQTCRTIFKPLSEPFLDEFSPLRVTHAAVDDKNVDGERIELFFLQAEAFHRTLASTWHCGCFDDDRMHQDAIFSFCMHSDSDSSGSNGTMYFRTEENATYGWKHTSFSHQRQLAPVKVVRVEETHVKHLERDGSRSERLCSALDYACAGDLIRITSGSEVWRCKGLGQVQETKIVEELPLSPCLQLRDDHPVFRLDERDRMMLAVYLAYAYLHLGGGDWWPHTTYSSVMIPNKIEADSPPLVFFAASLLQDLEDYERHIAEPQPNIMDQMFGPALPTLVALARLFYGLYIGRPVTWDAMILEMHLRRGESFATNFREVLAGCMELSKKTDESLSVRENVSKRKLYVKSVIIPLEGIVQSAFQITSRDIFAARKAAKRPRTSKPKRIKRTQAPAATPVVQPTESGFCLHDGQHDFESLDDNR